MKQKALIEIYVFLHISEGVDLKKKFIYPENIYTYKSTIIIVKTTLLSTKYNEVTNNK